MKNVLLASVFAAGTIACMTAPRAAIAQAPAGGQVQMSADEYNAYNASQTASTPAAKATALEAYLKAYPNSAVKVDALNQLMYAYYGAGDMTDLEGAVDRDIADDPNNLAAFIFAVLAHRQAADQLTDPAAKQAEYDKAANYATRGLSVTKSAATPQATFDELKGRGYPVFYSVLGTDDLLKKDGNDAVTAFKQELAVSPAASQTQPGQQLQDTFYLGEAYYQSTPPDYLDCAFYAARAANFAPEPYKTQFTTLAKYCYTKFHGKADGYDTSVAALAAASGTPPAGGLQVTPAPKPIDYVVQTVASTPDLAQLALGDKEFILQYGNVKDPKSATGETYSDEVFDTVKKETEASEFPDVVVIAATDSQLQVAISDDAKESKTADFTFNFDKPLEKVPAVGALVTISGFYTSYTSSPLMITMSKAALVEKPAARKPPVRRRR
jgi:hypothetical protein